MTFHGKTELEQKYFEAETKNYRQKSIDAINLDYSKLYADYCRGILDPGRIVNNLEPQHGVIPCNLDSAIQNGLSALGYAPQWALPSDCVHWEYPQASSVECNEGSSNEDCNLYCKETSKKFGKKDQEVGDFYKSLKTACQTELSIPKISKICQSDKAGVVKTDGGAGNVSSLRKSAIDWTYWEKNYPGLVPSNCDILAKAANPTSAIYPIGYPITTDDWKTVPKSAAVEQPWDFSKSREDAKAHENPRAIPSPRGFFPESEGPESAAIAQKLADVAAKNFVKNEKRRGNLTNCWEHLVEMSGQYPGHSRPPVGTPPPQNVWNHLTMTQGQGKNNGGNRGNVGGAGAAGTVPTTHDSLQRSYERAQSDLSYLLSEVSGLNMHPNALSGASLNPAGFYSHPSMARAASHLTSQLTPQLAHTQAPPTWHTPTVPSKSVAAANAPGNPLYSLQMLVDNRQNQNQYRNSGGPQSTLDLSATSEMAENYSRMTQDIPISLTARNQDKGSRNGNIISPPIPLNGETSSDSGISSSVPTPNSIVEPVSLSTKDFAAAAAAAIATTTTTTPKITVKNFESNLKGVANLHDKIKENENFAQKMMNLPPSVTIERITNVDKKNDCDASKVVKDTLSVIAQVPRNVLPVIVNLTSRPEKETIDSPLRDSSLEREKKLEENSSVRSPKNLAKRGKKGVDSLLEKLEGGNKKLGSTENIGSVIVTPLEDKDSVKSMSPERQKSKSPATTREDDVVSPAFSNDDSNDTTKQIRRKRKLEKPVRLSKDSKTEVEDMELEPTEPPRICEIVHEEAPPRAPSIPPLVITAAAAGKTDVPEAPESLDEDRGKDLEREVLEKAKEEEKKRRIADSEEKMDEKIVPETSTATTTTTAVPTMTTTTTTTKNEENELIKRRRSSEGPTTTTTPSFSTASTATTTNSNNNQTSQRTRRKSSDDAIDFAKASPKLVNNANPFNEVESELEKMFAGIVESGEDLEESTKTEAKDSAKDAGIDSTEMADAKRKKSAENETSEDLLDKEEFTNETINSIDEPTDVTSSTVTSNKPGTKKTRGKKGKSRAGGGGKRKNSRPRESPFAGSPNDETGFLVKDNKKKKGSKTVGKKNDTPTKKTKNKNVKTDGVREIAYDSGSNASSIKSRGPVVHVEGPRDSPLSVAVVNAPREEEEEKNKEKRKSVGNGSAGRSKRLSHQNDLDYRGKVSRAGLFSSTLSSRYDAHTTDSTWVCVFCKQGPHSVIPGDPSRPHPNLAGPHIAPGTYTVPAGVLSDLFGPYLIGKERLEEGILSADEQEITTEQKKGSKNKRSLRYAGLADQFSAKMSKKKRNSIESVATGTLIGMTLLPGDEQRWEVWLHEQCALWAAGVYMAGGRVTGLQEAVWDSTKSICGSCGITGANIGCVKRGCKAVTHYPCALTRGWLLDTNHYIPKCNLHRVT